MIHPLPSIPHHVVLACELDSPDAVLTSCWIYLPSKSNFKSDIYILDTMELIVNILSKIVLVDNFNIEYIDQSPS